MAALQVEFPVRVRDFWDDHTRLLESSSVSLKFARALLKLDFRKARLAPIEVARALLKPDVWGVRTRLLEVAHDFQMARTIIREKSVYQEERTTFKSAVRDFGKSYAASPEIACIPS